MFLHTGRETDRWSEGHACKKENTDVIHSLTSELKVEKLTETNREIITKALMELN